jgi:hypothetical protein
LSPIGQSGGMCFSMKKRGVIPDGVVCSPDFVKRVFPLLADVNFFLIFFSI